MVALATLLGVVLGLASAAVAWAHAELIGAEPGDGTVLDSSPQQVRLHFSEPIDSEFLALEVYAADRSRIDSGAPRLSPTDARVLEVDVRDSGGGTFTVVWRVVSLDSHVIRGVFAYTVGAGATPGRPLDLALPPSGAPFAVEAAARWATFVGLFVLLGGFLFRPLILEPALATVRRPDLADLTAQRWLPWAWAALSVLLVVAFASLLFQASSAAGVSLTDVLGGRAITRLLTATKYGWLWLARLGLLLTLAAILAWLTLAETRRVGWWAGSVVSAAALLTLSMTGHASAVQERVLLSVAADWVHLVAGGLWVGGLVQLAQTLPTVLRSMDVETRRQLLGRLVPRFSWLAGISVAVLVLSGVYASLVFVPSWQALADTVYGAWLSGKLLLVAVLLVLGAVNLFVLHPRFRRASAAPRGRAADTGGQRTFRWIVLGEVALATCVLAATGALTGVPPASSVNLVAQPFLETRRADESTSVTLSIRPNQAGDNVVQVFAEDARRQPIADVERVRLTLTMLDMQMTSREAEAQSTGEPGQFELRGNALSMPGHWETDVALRRGGIDQTTRFAFVVGDPPGLNRPAFSPGRVFYLLVVEPGRDSGIPISPRTLVALIALASAAILITRGGDVRRRADRARLVPVATLFLVVGLGIGGVRVVEAYRLSLPNPVPATGQSLARGQEVYETVGCASCHGLSGRGDGPEGRALRPRPADFRVHLAAGHTDRELFDWISNGITTTAMPPFKDSLSEEDRWNVINYIRTFAVAQRGG